MTGVARGAAPNRCGELISVNTDCIDKTSSAELSEAINSMFRWYENALVCYAHLSDIPASTEASVTFVKSRWFTRGWTLQELIAPRKLIFFTSNWTRIDTRDKLAMWISKATRVDQSFLKDSNIKIS